jgi:hypothetical protein
MEVKGKCPRERTKIKIETTGWERCCREGRKYVGRN